MKSMAWSILVTNPRTQELLLTEFTDEKEEAEKILFTPTGAYTAPTFWPSKEGVNPIEDIHKQFLLKMIELDKYVLESDARQKYKIQQLEAQLKPQQIAFVNVCMDQLKQNFAKDGQLSDPTWINEGRHFDTHIYRVNVDLAQIPVGFQAVAMQPASEDAYSYAAAEVLKGGMNIGWDIKGGFDITPQSTQTRLFKPFALQLNNTINRLQTQVADATGQALEALNNKLSNPAAQGTPEEKFLATKNALQAELRLALPTSYAVIESDEVQNLQRERHNLSA